MPQLCSDSPQPCNHAGDLWQFWYDALPAGTVTFNASVDDLGSDPLRPTVLGEAFDIAVVADGGWSRLRSLYFDERTPQYGGYQVWRFRVPAAAVPGFRAHGDYTVAGPDGTHFASIVLDVAMNDGTDWLMGGSAIAAPESEVTRPQAGANRQAGAELAEPSPPPWFLPWYKAHFGHISGGELYRVMAAAAEHGKISPPMPLFEFAAKRVVSGRRVLVGDLVRLSAVDWVARRGLVHEARAPRLQIPYEIP